MLGHWVCSQTLFLLLHLYSYSYSPEDESTCYAVDKVKDTVCTYSPESTTKPEVASQSLTCISSERHV